MKSKHLLHCRNLGSI